MITNMILQFVFLINFSIFTFVACQKYIEYPHKACAVRDVVENECNYCVCNNKYVYECYDKLCGAQKDIDQEDQVCQPRMVYVRDDLVCICTKHGKWPHEKCNTAFQSLQKNNSPDLKRCEPLSYVKVECNICRCNSNGEIDNEHCTKNNCTQIYIKSSRKSLPLPQSVHGHCEPKNWYSLAPCQFCFCINTNKLVCNTADFYNNKLQLGKYNLNICGKDFIKEAIDLIPEDNSNLRIRNNHGVKKTTTTTPVPVTRMNIKTTTKSNAVNNLPLAVREVITHKKTDDQGDSTEYYDEDEGKQESYKSNLALSDVKPDYHPLDQGNALAAKNKNDDYDENENISDDNPSKHANLNPGNMKSSINVDKIIINVDKSNKSVPSQSKALRDRDGQDNYVLDVFVPNVLESLFNMQLRKSMVRIDGNSNCVPGTKETEGCNTCFCLNNGNKLCTDKVCQ